MVRPCTAGHLGVMFDRLSNLLWRAFEIDRCFENASSGGGSSSRQPFIVVRREVEQPSLGKFVLPSPRGCDSDRRALSGSWCPCCPPQLHATRSHFCTVGRLHPRRNHVERAPSQLSSFGQRRRIAFAPAITLTWPPLNTISSLSVDPTFGIKCLVAS